MPRELTTNAAGRICQWPAREIDGLRGKEVKLTAQDAHGLTGTVGTSPYDVFDLTGARGTRFADGSCDLVIDDIDGEGRVLLGSELELLVCDQMLELCFHGAAGAHRGVRRLLASTLSAGRVESLRMLVDTSIVEVFVNGGEVTLTTRWYPQDVSELCVTSTLPGEHRAWEMGCYGFAGMGA